MIDGKRLTLFILILLVAIGIQVRSLELFGWGIDSSLVALLVFAFWATLTEELVLIILAALLLNWRPGFAPEIIIIVTAPLIVFLLRSVFPWRRGVTAGIFIVLSLTVLYGMYVGRSLVHQGFFWKDLITSLVLGGLLFLFLRTKYQAFRTAGRSAFYALPR